MEPMCVLCMTWIVRGGSGSKVCYAMESENEMYRLMFKQTHSTQQETPMCLLECFVYSQSSPPFRCAGGFAYYVKSFSSCIQQCLLLKAMFVEREIEEEKNEIIECKYRLVPLLRHVWKFIVILSIILKHNISYRPLLGNYDFPVTSKQSPLSNNT